MGRPAPRDPQQPAPPLLFLIHGGQLEPGLLRCRDDPLRLLAQDPAQDHPAALVQRFPERPEQRHEHAAQDVGSDDVEAPRTQLAQVLRVDDVAAELDALRNAVALEIGRRVDHRVGIALHGED